MYDSNGVFADEQTVNVILEGGPFDFPETERERQIAREETRIKIAHRGGYEHFERVAGTPTHGDVAPVVFRWTLRTRIAE